MLISNIFSQKESSKNDILKGIIIFCLFFYKKISKKKITAV